MKENIKRTLKSNLEIGEECKLSFPADDITIDGGVYVRAIIFTNMKVRYSVFLSRSKTTLHNVDSVFCEKIENPNFVDFADDNYS
jgi:hypothetical protein